MKTDLQRALVLGGSGQDGSLLTSHLERSGWSVSVTGRSLDAGMPANWARLGIGSGVDRYRLDLLDRDAVTALLRHVRPEAIFCLAAQSSVGASFADPGETYEANLTSVLNVLEAVRGAAPAARVLIAGSGECFGHTTREAPATEEAPFRPTSPYGSAKAMACIAARNYRDAYGLHISIAHLFGHESPLRGPAFVFGRLLDAIAAIRAGTSEFVELGSLAVVRDWGWAPDYVEAMAQMVQCAEPHELILATGNSVSLEDAARALFSAAGFDFDKHVRVSSRQMRPHDIPAMHADPSRAGAVIGWNGSTPFPGLARRLIEDRLA